MLIQPMKSFHLYLRAGFTAGVVVAALSAFPSAAQSSASATPPTAAPTDADPEPPAKRPPSTPPKDCKLDEAATKAWGRPICVPPPPPAATDAELAQEQALKQRAQRYWDALREGRHGDAWDFISPAGRLTVTREAYALRMATIPLVAANVKEVLCRGGKCRVTALLEFDASVPRVGKIRQSALETDTWMQQDGQLWLILR